MSQTESDGFVENLLISPSTDRIYRYRGLGDAGSISGMVSMAGGILVLPRQGVSEG